MCFVGPNCPASVSAELQLPLWLSVPVPRSRFIAFRFICTFTNGAHTHKLIHSPRHTSNVSCGFGWLATPFFRRALWSKKKSVFFTCVIWLSASLRPLHSYVFCHPFRKVTLYLLKRRKRYRALYRGTLEMPC